MHACIDISWRLFNWTNHWTWSFCKCDQGTSQRKQSTGGCQADQQKEVSKQTQDVIIHHSRNGCFDGSGSSCEYDWSCDICIIKLTSFCYSHVWFRLKKYTMNPNTSTWYSNCKSPQPIQRSIIDTGSFSVSDGELFEHVVQQRCLSERDTRFLFYQLFSAIRVSLLCIQKVIF